MCGRFVDFYVILVYRFRVVLVPRSALHTTRTLANEIKIIVCPAFADSISEGDIRYSGS